MPRRVMRKQFNARMCLVCGTDNPYGLHASFYELEDNQLIAVFTPKDFHQSYPQRMHGGITTAILDETIGRAIMIGEGSTIWGVTVEFTTKYRKPVPLDVELRVVGRIIKNEKRIFEGTGELLLPDGTVAAEGSGRYLKMPIEKITDKALTDDWKIIPDANGPLEFEI